MSENDLSTFNNETFKLLVEDLLHDALYLEGRKNRGKISTIRQYTEVIVRKILNYSESERVTLGYNKVRGSLSTVSGNNKLVIDAIENIHRLGNKTTHTQYVDDVPQEDVDSAINSLFDLYAFMFVSYFNKYRFGSNPRVISVFSILPPIIRYIALKELYKNDCDNISIIDKYSLSILKAFDIEQAIDWLNERKDMLSCKSAVTPEVVESWKNIGEAFASEMLANVPDMYTACLNNLYEVDKTLDVHGRLYHDFESALELYKKEGTISGDSDDIVEFNSLMEFVYLGRQEVKNTKLENVEQYLTWI